jgi:hypothetical protein
MFKELFEENMTRIEAEVRSRAAKKIIKSGGANGRAGSGGVLELACVHSDSKSKSTKRTHGAHENTSSKVPLYNIHLMSLFCMH